MNRQRLEQMFSEMVVRKNAALIPHYYHPAFVFTANGQVQDYEAFAEGHRRV